MNLWMFLSVGMRGALYSRLTLLAENLALRQQLAIYQRTQKRQRLKRLDRIFWSWLARLWPDWRTALVVVRPETVVGWHRQGFKLYWRWKSRRKPGRPAIDRQLIALVRRIAQENPTWGAPRIASELRLLGREVADSTVAKYMPRGTKPSSPTWRTFLANHLPETASIDFFAVPTATFRLLYVFVVLSLDRRKVLHFGVTEHPSAAWTAQQLREAFPYESAPKYLTRDRDAIYGEHFQRCVRGMNVEEVVSAPRSPWQNPYVERLIGSARRECLDHVIVLNEAHLRRILADYFGYYNGSRPHLSLDRNAPVPREIEPPELGEVVAVPLVGGLHHRYTRRAG